MTAGLPEPPLATSAEVVARETSRGLRRRARHGLGALGAALGGGGAAACCRVRSSGGFPREPPGPFDTAELPLAELDPSAAVRRRRLDSQRVRRRRLLVADLGIGAALGLLCLILTPGLAIAALVALVGLAGYGLATAARLLRRRRARGSSAAGPVQGRGPRGSAAAVRVEDRRGRSSSSRDAWRAP